MLTVSQTLEIIFKILFCVLLRSCKLEPGDELLEIDSKKLYAINHLDLLNILKGLSNKTLTLVCARKKIRKFNSSLHDENDSSLKNKLISKRAKSAGNTYVHTKNFNFILSLEVCI